MSLFDHWSDGYKTLHGFTTRGFPNQFFTGFITGAASRRTSRRCYEQQAEHIAYVIAEALRRGVTSLEPTQEAQDAWCRHGEGDGDRQLRVRLSECTPGYYNNEGGGGGEGLRSHLGELYAPGFYAFDDLLTVWRDKGDLDGLELGLGEPTSDGRVQHVTTSMALSTREINPAHRHRDPRGQGSPAVG